MNPALQTLINQFNDNLGNKLTMALANGILLEVDKALKAMEPPKETQDVEPG